MKAAGLYLLAVLFAGILIYLTLNLRERIIPKAMTVETTYVYLLNEETFSLNLWVNRLDHVFVMEDGIILSSVENKEQTMKLEIVLLEMVAGRTETYLGETYTCYEMVFEMPRLMTDFIMDDAFLRLITSDQKEHVLEIGSLDLRVVMSSWKMLPFKDLYALKNDNDFHSRIGTIHVVTDFPMVLESASIRANETLDHTEVGNDITISASSGNRVMNKVPLVILSTDGTTYYIPTFEYVRDYRIFATHGGEIHVHAFD